MINRRPSGRIIRGWAPSRKRGASLIKNRFRYTTWSGRASYTFAVLHQMIILLEVVKNLANLIGLRVKTAHHFAFLCQLMLTLLQGKYVQKRKIYVFAKILSDRKDSSEIKIPITFSTYKKKTPKYANLMH